MTLQSLELASRFGLLDWAIVIAYLGLTVAIGVAVNRCISGMADYIVAGRSLRSYLGIATMVGSELGLVTVMYAAQAGFTGGFAAFHIGLVAGVTTLVIGLTGFIVVPLRRMGVMTIPEYYDRRFGPKVRVYGGLLLAGAGVLNMGLFLRAGALFVSGLTGLHEPWHVNLIMTTLLVLVLVYTVLGGMVSVIITDYLQFIVLSIGMLTACGVAVSQLGWDPIVEAVSAVHGPAGFDPLDASGFGLSYVVWMILTAGIVSAAVWQTAVMRACSAESVAVVRRLYTFSSIGFLIRFMLPQFLGICALAFFLQHPGGAAFLPDGAVASDPDTTLRAMPVFLGQLLPTGLLGLIGAGMLAAFMSTHDSYLLCWASVLAHDVVDPLTGGRLPDRTKLRITRALIVAIGVFLLVWGLWFPLSQGLWDYMAVTGAIYFTGAFAVLLLGLYWRGASRVGATLAITAGAFNLLGLAPVQELLRVPSMLGREQPIRGDHVGLTVTTAALVLMVVGSLLWPDPRSAEPAPAREGGAA